MALYAGVPPFVCLGPRSLAPEERVVKYSTNTVSASYKLAGFIDRT
jgi:hypothetical protein